ncbi:DUF3769 domain-containing protein [Cyanobacterium aponinum FACHB-4101]|uniref:DUF3769 domain-containing protein n=1 Tax=Cyanobacterium aponinum TaxID=379064 RepID=UPI0016803C8D|nr:DUF3769 domain-containing protein [Cyanobacterium aponinum]MBD2394613.1 DUF3769 domain-containing protein [Cyanobacterium aponinum FACHB-4101]
MIPILSSTLIAVTPYNGSIQEDNTTIVNQNPSSIILAEKDTSVFSPRVQREEISPIPISVENPPETTADGLGTPLKINSLGQSTVSFDDNSSFRFATDVKRLITVSRKGSSREYDFYTEGRGFSVVQNQNTQEGQEVVNSSLNVVEILADEQEYLDQQEIVKARGNVVIRFSNGVLRADLVSVNLRDRIAVAEGNVSLQRGEQSLRGDRFEYYFVRDEGVIFNAQGEIYQPNLAQDFRGDTGNNPVNAQILSQQIEANQPLRRVTSAEGYSFVVGSVRDLSLLQQAGGAPSTSSGGQINRFRFQAEKVDFNSEGWFATNIRITNDPFSPPEFEIRADTARLRSISPFQDELTTTKSRLVFDQTVSIPLFQDRLVFDRRDRRPGLFNIGFDGEDLGGLYIERDFEVYSDQKTRFTLTPRILLQRAFFPDSFFDDNAIDPEENGGIFNPSSYGLVANLEVDFAERTRLNGILNFTGLDLDNIENRLRGSVQLDQKLGELNAPHTLSLQYNYRDRLFNGSLGFQTVQQSYGVILTSPYIPIANSPFGLVYQASVQNINADTDRDNLLRSNRDNNRATLTRFQGAAIVTSNFLLWSGEALPPTPDQGLRFTPTPVVPYLSLNTGLTGVGSYYSNGETQPSITATVGLQGQIGHFSDLFFDYTGFQVSFSQGIRGDQSPFFFDRFADDQVLSLGLTQQLYGPIRAGVQSFINVKTSQEISTDYFLEFSRRTYNIILRYNPVLELGSVNLRISDFNWEGDAGSFEGSTGVRSVVDGVTRGN